ncbi:MAG TPA: tRNA (adenosine(37)-N6)-threonylcarbamoyltransferase complex dimerization subunit type 1 TsaB [Polyangiaceae bacterium]|nr:tRNA (adenosine(37)-N6)-threonylcarbamoyltransferase complex dimerization subunit type 1 TsaB [Polyangiaceae bacterium]
MASEATLLALDTSTDRGSVALARAGEGGRLEALAAHDYDAEPGHAERLLPAIDALFRGTGLGLGGLSAIAVGVGPGSFSGLRVGVTTAKALGFAGGVRVVGVSGLAALAAASGAGAGLVVALLDARRDEAFAAAYRAGDWLEPAEPPRLLSLDEARRWVGSLPGPRTLVGSGAPLVDPAAAAGPAHPPALAIAALAAALLARGGDPLPTEPLYVRPPNATPPRPARA